MDIPYGTKNPQPSAECTINTKPTDGPMVNNRHNLESNRS